MPIKVTITDAKANEDNTTVIVGCKIVTPEITFIKAYRIKTDHRIKYTTKDLETVIVKTIKEDIEKEKNERTLKKQVKELEAWAGQELTITI